MNGWLMVDDVASIIGVHKRTIQRWCREGEIPHVRKGRLIRFLPEQVDEIAAEYTTTKPPKVEDVPNPDYSPTRSVVVPIRRKHA